ncbi:hypothetical protein D3C73_417490 [compost metagenome]
MPGGLDRVGHLLRQETYRTVVRTVAAAQEFDQLVGKYDGQKQDETPCLTCLRAAGLEKLRLPRKIAARRQQLPPVLARFPPALVTGAVAEREEDR